MDARNGSNNNNNNQRQQRSTLEVKSAININNNIINKALTKNQQRGDVGRETSLDARSLTGSVGRSVVVVTSLLHPVV